MSDIYQCVGCNSFNLQVRYFQIVKFLYFFFIKIVLHFNINAIPQWRSKGGGDGAVRPGRHFLGGGKIEVIPKNRK